MLEGREDLSEVQDNPFAEMMKEDEAAEAAMSGAPTESVPTENIATPANEPEPVAETVPAEPETIPVEPEPAEEQKPADTSKMSDEEFEAFMKKAQAFYSGQQDSSEVPAGDSSEDDEDEGPTVYGAGDQ